MTLFQKLLLKLLFAAVLLLIVVLGRIVRDPTVDHHRLALVAAGACVVFGVFFHYLLHRHMWLLAGINALVVILCILFGVHEGWRALTGDVQPAWTVFSTIIVLLALFGFRLLAATRATDFDRVALYGLLSILMSAVLLGAGIAYAFEWEIVPGSSAFGTLSNRRSRGDVSSALARVCQQRIRSAYESGIVQGELK